MAGITATPEWLSNAVGYATTNSKLSSTYATTALNKYLSTGSTAGLSTQQAATVNKVLNKYGAPPTPAAAPADSGAGADAGIDPIQAAYNPVLDFLKSQATAAQDRYGQNKADITNLFGTLSTVRAADIPKIQQQYATSIQQQQDAVAQRMALQNVQTQQGAQGAATAGAELGGADMPAPTNSLSAQAGTAANTDANAYQTTWNALQQVMSAQDQQNVRNAQYGYDAQQSSALLQMQRQLEDRLAQINGDIAGTQSQVAQSQLGAQAASASAQADAQALQDKLNNEAYIAGIGANAKLGAAQIAADARTTAAKTSAANKAANNAAKTTLTPAKSLAQISSATNVLDWASAIRRSPITLMSGVTNDNAVKPLKLSIKSVVNKLTTSLTSAAKKANPVSTKTVVPTSAQIQKAWLAAHADATPAAKKAAIAAIQKGIYKTF
jgi:hypothetical protein